MTRHVAAPVTISRSTMHFFERSDEPWGVKDRQSRFVYANQSYFDFLEIQSDIASRITDFSYADIPAFAPMAAQLIAHDQQVMKSEKRTEAIGTLMIGKRYCSFIFERMPYYSDEGVVAGTMFHMKPFERISMDYFLDKPFYGEAVFTPPVTVAGTEIIRFTNREWDVLFLLFRGTSKHQIAEILDLSENTVRNVTASLVSKTHSPSRERMMETGISAGWHLYVPPRFISIGYDILFKQNI